VKTGGSNKYCFALKLTLLVLNFVSKQFLHYLTQLNSMAHASSSRSHISLCPADRDPTTACQLPRHHHQQVINYWSMMWHALGVKTVTTPTNLFSLIKSIIF
jgi:hypothetical protein